MEFFMKKASTAELDAFYPVREECRVEVPKTRFRLRAGKTLSARRWHAAFSEDGHLDIASVLRRIQRGGIHPAIKGVVWEFLLGCFDPSSTFDERNDLRQQRREMYVRLKAECNKMVPVIGSGKFITTPLVTDDGDPIDGAPNGARHDVSDKKVIQWKLFLHQIGLDVVRTDRTLVFYESETNQAKLWEILSVYAWMDNDIGYVQGMNDICSPIVILIENHADAFWCFERAMRKLRENFRCTSTSMGVQSQLATLSQVIRTIDPKLHQHLEELDGGEYLFAFRMLMVLFRREFSFVDSLYLWEVRMKLDLYFHPDWFQLMWAMEYNPNIFSSYETSSAGTTPPNASDKELKAFGKFERNNVKTGYTEQHGALSVFLVASVLETKNKQLLKNAKGLDDVVNILGDITGNLDARKACNEALKIHKKYLKNVKS
ncbi:uncharacterized protein LOC133740434 isoform X2 [Rosa rugosa]|uniref:uncharacterized protein LOC133740434 isoform X2 n=1 Tax=Rosa rugosa TaxID=74645 RepID=UPI002B403D56|nr:uncharacterized protein LOC133740434 isoform X2 [Rosa rugosa]